MPARGDERGYLGRARAAHWGMKRVLKGKSLGLQDVERWYGGGRWGPLYPGVLGAGFFFSDEQTATARLIVSLVGALTTPLVFVLTRRIAGRRAACIAALFHAGYSGFVVFSHLLWSETFFIFLVLLTLFLAHGVQPGAPPGRNLRAAIGSGVALGLAGLVRATILPFVVLLPLWLALRQRTARQRIAVAALALLACLGTLSPWLTWQYAMEGHFVPLSTTSNLNLFRGNRPAAVSEADVAAYAEQSGADVDCVMRELALAEIKRDPGAWFARGLKRSLRGMWAPEVFVRTHLRLAVYPPLPLALVALWFLGSLAVYLALVALAGFGFRLEMEKLDSSGNLLLAMVLSSLIFTFATQTAAPRIALVDLALMLPMAGHGAAHLGRWRSLRWKLPSLLFVLALPLSILSTLTGGAASQTTGYYAPLVAEWNGSVGRRTAVLDRIELRGSALERDDLVTLRPTDDSYRLGLEAEESWQWELTPEVQVAALRISANDADRPVRLTVASRNLDRQVELAPLRPEAWRQWRATGLPGIDFRWLPAAQTRREAASEAARSAGQAPSSQPSLSVPQCLPAP